jgi:glycerol kinase
MLLNTGQRPVQSTRGLVTTLCPQVGDEPATYALEGSIAITGALVQWFRDKLELIGSAPEIETLARSVADTGGCYFVPAFSGLYAPHWRSDARGVITGLTGYITKAHLARAVLEATAWQSREVLDAMVADAGVELNMLRVDGGMTANNLLMQMVADVLDLRVVRPMVAEAVSLGAAYAAGLAVGGWGRRRGRRARGGSRGGGRAPPRRAAIQLACRLTVVAGDGSAAARAQLPKMAQGCGARRRLARRGRRPGRRRRLRRRPWTDPG